MKQAYEHNYPSDVSREQFALIESELEGIREITRPRKYDVYDVFCAIMYLLKSGCQWRMIPVNFPPMGTVRYYYDMWTEATEGEVSLLSRVLKKLVSMIRNDDCRKDETTFGIVDSQSVQNADCANEKGYDGGKKTSGIKRHIVVDTNGLPHAIHITTADVSDRDGALSMISLYHDNLSSIKKFLCDGGYTGESFANSVDMLHGATVEIVKRNELHQFAVLPKRWVVERSFGWLDKYRRLWKNCERLILNSLHMVILAFISVTIR